ncbi:MAG: DUF1496 domain-containing protein [Gammaproteobacteria bacterium]|nr:DUF1496 domain-containing protein [Gammaproteobacteria bacterium]
MTELKHTQDVGAPDPELNTSPIADENSSESEVLRQEMPGEPVCYFNNRSFPTGTYIKSGTSLLKCVYGIWEQAGSADPDNP